VVVGPAVVLDVLVVVGSAVVVVGPAVVLELVVVVGGGPVLDVSGIPVVVVVGAAVVVVVGPQSHDGHWSDNVNWSKSMFFGTR
jgi:hypothetical protein